MAELKEIIDKERQREGRQEFLTVHLYQDGSFYRAYDWSAWLWSAVPLYIIRRNNDRAADEGEENESKALRTLTDVHDALFFCPVIQKVFTSNWGINYRTFL